MCTQPAHLEGRDRGNRGANLPKKRNRQKRAAHPATVLEIGTTELPPSLPIYVNVYERECGASESSRMSVRDHQQGGRAGAPQNG